MTCTGCQETAEGFAVTPGVGRLGEIRFFCDGCARKKRVKMRYWDGRDLDVGGWREDPDLGDHFHSLVFSFQDIARMRKADLGKVWEWVEDVELAAAMVGADNFLQSHVMETLPRDRGVRVRKLLQHKRTEREIQESQKKIVSVIRRL